MKKFVSILLASLSASSLLAFPSYDPFVSAVGTNVGLPNAGTSYAIAAKLAHQTNGVGEGWALWNGGTGASVVVTSVALQYTNPLGVNQFPAGFPPATANSILLPDTNSATQQGTSAALQFSRSIYPPSGQASQYGAATTNRLFASFLMDVPTEYGLGSAIYLAGFCGGGQGGDQSFAIPTGSSDLKMFFAASNFPTSGNSVIGTNYAFGLADGGGAGDAVNSAKLYNNDYLHTNTCYFVVIDYEFGGTNTSVPASVTNDWCRFWINPVTSTFGASTQPTELGKHVIASADRLTNAENFYVVARNGATMPSNGVYIADLRIGTTWSYVTGGPEFTQQPSGNIGNIVVSAPGQNASFTGVAVAGGSSVTYQWQLNGVNLNNGGAISGATSSSLAISGLVASNLGSYTIIATDPVSSITSSVVTISTITAITTQPASTNLPPGGIADFNLFASGIQPLTYQWQFNGSTLTNGPSISGSGAAVSGATSSNLTVSGVLLADVGSYTCLVTDGIGAVVPSTAATLQVFNPAITVQPQNTTNNYGGTAQLSVSALGTPTLTYQWLFNGVPLPASGPNPNGTATVSGGQSSTLSLANVTYLDIGTYAVYVTNGSGASTLSSNAFLQVNDPYFVTTLTNMFPLVNSTFQFGITASGTPNLTYQWQQNGANLQDNVSQNGAVTGSQTSSLTISPVTSASAGTYSIIVSGGSPFMVTNSAILTPTTPLSLVTGPVSYIVNANAHVAFRVVVSGTAPAYQWSLNGNSIAGAIGSILSVSNITVPTSGVYSVTITNANGTLGTGLITASASLSVSNLIHLAPTNLIIARVGDGLQTLNQTTGNTLYLDQYGTNGSYFGTIMVPDSLPNGVAFPGPALLEVGGSGTDGVYESVLNMSTNADYLDIAGYVLSSGGNINAGGSVRGLGAINGLGYYALAYTNTGLYSGSTDIRSTFSPDGLTNFWTTGVASSGGAIKYVNAGPLGASYATGNGVPAIVGSAAGTREVQQLFGNLVYSDVGGLAGIGIYSCVGMPTTAAKSNLLVNVQGQFGSSSSPTDFAISPDGNTIYIADDEVYSGSGGGGGIQRWDTNSGGGFNYSYTLGPLGGANATNGARSIAVDWSDNTSWGQGQNGAIIYATSAALSTNSVIELVDNGNPNSTLPTISVLATAGPNELLRGVRFGPAQVPLSIVNPPQNVATYTGQSVVLSITVTGDQPLTFVWQTNGVTVPVASQTTVNGAYVTSMLTLPNAQTSFAGSYTVIVTNDISSNSAGAAVSVSAGPPSFSLVPHSSVETVGDHLAFVAAATGTAPISYQWASNGVPIAGATTNYLAFANIQLAYSASYSLTVTNIFGTNSFTNTLLVTSSLQPLSSTNLVVSVVGDGVEPLSDSTGNTLYLQQFLTNGSYVNTIMMPDSVASTALIVQGGFGSGTVGSVLNLSANDVFLNFCGYNAVYPNPLQTFVAAPTTFNPASDVSRAIGSVNAFGYYTLAQTNDTVYDTGPYNINSVVSSDGYKEFWSTGDAGADGVKYFTQAQGGPSGGNVGVGGSPTGPQVVELVSGYVAYSDSLASPPGIWAFAGEPTAGASSANFIKDVSGNPQDFAASPDTTGFPPGSSTVYVCDTSSAGSGGGIQRYDWNGAAYALSYTLGTGNLSTNGAGCLAVDFSANSTWGPGITGAVIYATTSGLGNQLIRIVDTGANSTATVLAQASQGQILRGVRFGPTASAAIIAANPVDTNTLIGGSVTFKVNAQNGPISGYQWQLNGVSLTNGPSISGSGAMISGAFSNLLIISNVGPLDDQGSYTVIVTNPYPTPAISSAAVLSVPVQILTNPVPFELVTSGATVVFSVSAIGGTPNGTPLTYQWNGPCGTLSDGPNNCNGASSAITGSSSSNLTISGVTAADTGSYYVIVSNPDSSSNSFPGYLYVESGAPTFLTNTQPASLVLPVGFKAVFTAQAVGDTPLSLQWMLNGTNLVDNGHVSGSQSGTLIVNNAQLSDSGYYMLFVSNPSGTNYSAPASLTVTLINFTNGVEFSQNGHASYNDGTLSLTDGGASETSSSFMSNDVDVAAFISSWVYQNNGSVPYPSPSIADGVAFVVQNTAAGTAAIGGGGNNLGYIGISNSVAFEFNIFSNNTVGIAIGTNGLGKDGTTGTGGGPYGTTGSVVLSSGDPIGVFLSYLNGVASLSLTDSVTTASFSTNYQINIPGFVRSNAACIGFTGSSGAVTANQTISDFFFTSWPSVSVQNLGGGALALTWPVTAAGFQLQAASSLSSPNWTAVTNVTVTVGNQNQAVVTPAGSPQYYRLVIQ